MGDKPTGARVRSPVACIAERKETELLKPIDEEYSPSGALLSAGVFTPITGLSSPAFMVEVESNGNLFVTNGNGTVGDYSPTGAHLAPSLISGLNEPRGIATDGTNLFVDNYSTGVIGEYTTSGATVSASLISGLSSSIQGLALVSTPEPGSIALVGFGLTGIGLIMRRKRLRTKQ